MNPGFRDWIYDFYASAEKLCGAVVSRNACNILKPFQPYIFLDTLWLSCDGLHNYSSVL